RCIYSSRVGLAGIADRRPRTSDRVATGNHHRVFAARRDTLPAVAEFIAAVCAAGGVPRKTCLRLTLLVEELFTTTVVHGHAVDGRVGIVTLNRADKLNAISAELKSALVERLHAADRDPATAVVVLRAEGRSFCAGYDIGPNPGRAARRHNALAWHESLTDDVRLEMTPWEMKKPVIASVQGHCLGGGCELVVMCALTIAAGDA